MPRSSPTHDELDRLDQAERDISALKKRFLDPFIMPPVVWIVAGPDYPAAGGNFSLEPLGSDWGIPVDGPSGQEQIPPTWSVPVLGSSGGWGSTYLNDPGERHTAVTVPEPGVYIFGCMVNDMLPRQASGDWDDDTDCAWIDSYVYTRKADGSMMAQFNGARAINMDEQPDNRGGQKAGATGLCQLEAGDAIGSFFRPEGPLLNLDHIEWGGFGTAIPLLWAAKVPGP